MSAESVCLSPNGDDRFAVWYQVECDSAWGTTRLRARLIGDSSKDIDVSCKGGMWSGKDGPISELDGCTDVDISVTPFTNTLPIKRLQLSIGQVADIKVAYLKVPDFELVADPQRYTRIATNLYKFESVDTDFVAEIEVDQNDLVATYPGLFLRIL